MPAKGQSCQTCIGTCCHQIIGYRYSPEVKEDLLKKHAAGEITEWSTKPDMDWTVKQLKEMGMVEVRSPDKGYEEGHCPSQLPDGRCKLHGPDKPKLCKTYWCHGALWKPKPQDLGIMDQNGVKGDLCSTNDSSTEQ